MSIFHILTIIVFFIFAFRTTFILITVFANCTRSGTINNGTITTISS
jgi:hypothetical protein